MKKKVFLKRIFHNDKWRIAIIFEYDEEVKASVKSIMNVTYSKTHKCYYLDDSEGNLKLIIRTLKDLCNVDISSLIKKDQDADISEFFLNSGTAGSKSTQTCSGQEEEPEFISHQKTISNVTVNDLNGDKSESGDNLLAFNRNSFLFSSKHIEKGKDDSGLVPGHKTIQAAVENYKFGPVEFRISEKDGLLVIKFLGRYDPKWVEELKTYDRCFYDKNRKEWLLTWSKMNCDSLADFFTSRGIEVNVIRNMVSDELKAERKGIGDEIRSRNLGEKAMEGLELLRRHLDDNRFSPRTRESYLSLLELFFRYFSSKDPLEIDEDEITGFIHDYIIKLGYSAAYQNQMVSAIKAFYTTTGKSKIEPEFFERPRRSRALPKVFSKDEVKRILNATRNNKHKLLLWVIYSCGLRRSEVTNILLTDLDRDRRVLHIREGKGRVDRIVPVSDKVWEKLDEYVDGFCPRKYLFEGQNGGRYSVESVYRVFKQALKKAGIMKEVGVHCLRHSYATHLHESGLDIRYIQELLGHKSTRTTEIYTHVSRRNLVAIRSPIEDLDVK